MVPASDGWVVDPVNERAYAWRRSQNPSNKLFAQSQSSLDSPFCSCVGIGPGDERYAAAELENLCLLIARLERECSLDDSRDQQQQPMLSR